MVSFHSTSTGINYIWVIVLETDSSRDREGLALLTPQLIRVLAKVLVFASRARLASAASHERSQLFQPETR